MSALELVRAAGPDASRAPLLLVHGICHGAWCWQEHYQPYFATRRTSVALSLRGHGASAGRESLDRFGLQDYVDDVLEVATTLDRPPVIVGHSMGGAIAQLALRRAPARFTAAVLLAPMVPGGLKAREFLRLAMARGALSSTLRQVRGRRVATEQAQRLPFFAPTRFDRDTLARYADQLQAESRRAILDLLGFTPPAGPAPVPMLVIGSSADLLFGEGALRRTAAHYPGAELCVLPGGCHDLMLDPDWERSAGRIAGWLEHI